MNALFNRGEFQKAVDIFRSMNMSEKNGAIQDLLDRGEYKKAECVIEELIREQEQLIENGTWTLLRGETELAETHSMMGKAMCGLSKYACAYDHSVTSWKLFVKAFTENHWLSKKEEECSSDYWERHEEHILNFRRTAPAAE